MRLLILHEHQTAPGQGGGGAESLLRDLASGLKARGHTVSWWWGQGSVERAVEAFEPDLIQMQTLHNFLPNWQEVARWVQGSGIPHVWALMDYWPFCVGRMLLTHSTHGEPCRAVLDVCDGKCACGRSPSSWLDTVNRSPVVAYNPHTADIYRRHGLRCDYVAELGVDVDLFKPDPDKRESGSVYTSSAWPEYPVKGMPVLKEAIKGRGITANLLTHLPREQVAEGLRRADVYVFPSIYEETWGLCLNEAMASGCACVASDVAGARAQIRDGVMGLLVPPRNPDALRDAIEYLLRDEQTRRQFGDAARRHVEQEHSLGAMAERWEAVYRDVLGRKHVTLEVQSGYIGIKQ